MELALSILGIIALLIPIAWSLYQTFWGKKAAEQKRRAEEDKKASEDLSKEQKGAIEDGKVHDVQDAAEEAWRKRNS